MGKGFLFKKRQLTIHQGNSIGSVYLGTAQIKVLGNRGINVAVRALCDNGSEVNLVTASTVQQLLEKPRNGQTTFFGVGGNSLGSSLGVIYLKIELKDGGWIADKFYVVKSITKYNPMGEKKKFPLLTSSLADENYFKPGTIHALLGISVWIKIIQSNLFHSNDNRAIAHKSKLGYIVFSNDKDPYESENPYIGAVGRGVSLKALSEIMQKLWEIEEIPNERKRTKEEELCEDIFVSQHSRDASGRYMVRLPFNEKVKMLGKSKKMAIRQFLATERRMKRDPEFAAQYRLFMTEYEALGHMESVWDEAEEGYYTPHHGVFSSRKFRVVFNASAKTTSDISLNETQMVGEKLQPDLIIILIEFRINKFGLTADVIKMYRQVKVHPEDRKFQRIVYRESESEPIRTYEMNTVTYGHACAPHCAIRSLIQCANDHESQFPVAAKTVRKRFYVDDVLTGASDELELPKVKKDLSSLLNKGGFELTKWKTNASSFGTHEIGETDQQSVLGLCWDLSKDTFFYKLREPEAEATIWTKRKILSRIGKLYDPSGFLGPVIIRGKMIIQDLWKSNTDWDEEVKGEIKSNWGDFYHDLKNIHLISINRWIGTGKNLEIQIHGFCDASEKGYGAVVYSRVRDQSAYRSEIIISKSRVAPLKTTTIPRLELCAASLLAKLIKMVAPIFGEKGKKEIFCWSDSQIVLQWLLKPSNGLKIFVGNRIEEIQRISEEFEVKWNWVIGKDNPADLISRGLTILELHNEPKWWHGPKWLNQVESDWPQQPTFSGKISLDTRALNEIIKEEKKVHLVNVNLDELERGKWFRYKGKQENFSILDTYSDWKKLLNVTATVCRAAHKFETLKNKKIGNISNEFRTLATNYLIRLDQNRSFPVEINAAKTGNRTLLAKLVLVWDTDDQFLRIDGRVRSSNLSRDEQFPIVLNKNSKLAELLMRDAHLVAYENGHAGTQQMLQYLRQKYWIIGARRIAKNITRKCPTCFRLRMRNSQQLMSTLPTIRTSPKLAFVNVGVDYAGPITTRAHLGRTPRLEKAWIAVFVCLVTRAVHLELVRNASSKAFVEALKRLIARRGRVSHIISDNATNFVGANNYLKMVAEQVNQDSEVLSNQFRIKWTFATPGAPHHGGIYEAAVKSVKYHLIRIIRDTTLTYDEYDTLLCQTEAFLNSRPISPLNDDPTSLNALTPGHFLVFEELVRIPDERDFRNIPDNRLERPELIQKMLQNLWDRWHHEYVTTLINRSKWLTQERNLEVGDMVIVKEENVPPIQWKLGRVQEVFPNKIDDLVRSVIVRTPSGVYKRPITKLGLLLPSEKL